MLEYMCLDCGRTFVRINNLNRRCPLCSFNRYNKPRKPLKRMGRVAKEWAAYRNTWFKEHLPDSRGYYDCGICGKPVHIDETVLDHRLPRSNRPDLRYEDSNIVPAHWACNSEKGSRH